MAPDWYVWGTYLQVCRANCSHEFERDVNCLHCRSYRLPLHPYVFNARVASTEIDDLPLCRPGWGHGTEILDHDALWERSKLSESA